MIESILNPYNFGVFIIGLLITWLCYNRYKKTKSQSLLNCLPGVFTSLGLLGTFFAICVSLSGLENVSTEETSNIVGKTVGEIQNEGINIITIIHQLVPAFTSSICGLLCALGITVWTKLVFAKEDAEEAKKLNDKSPEEYIRDIAELIKLQNDQNKEYNDKLNNAISNQSNILKEFVEGFVKRMDEMFIRVQGNIQQQVKDFGELQFIETSKVIVSITEKLSKISEEIIKNQSESVNTAMTNTRFGIDNITTTITNTLEKLTKEINDSLATMNTAQFAQFDKIIQDYNLFFSKLSEQNMAFAKNATKQMDYLRTSFKESTSEVLQDTLNMVQNVTDNLRESLKTIVTDISSECKTLSEVMSMNVESLNKAYKFIKNHIAEICQNYNQAVISYGDAVGVAHRTNESAEKAIVAITNTLESMEGTNKNIAQVIDLLEMRQDNIDLLINRINAVSAAIVELQKLESILNKIIK